MKWVAATALGMALAASGATAHAQGGVSLRVGGKEIPLTIGTSVRLAALAREMFSRCGPNTRLHQGNFAASTGVAATRRDRTHAGSRLQVAFDPPFETVSHLGGKLRVAEATIGLDDAQYFVGPTFTADGHEKVEHLHCEYLPALEIACLPDLAPHLPARYRDTCARLARGADGRIVMPPPDIAPSCS